MYQILSDFSDFDNLSFHFDVRMSAGPLVLRETTFGVWTIVFYFFVGGASLDADLLLSQDGFNLVKYFSIIKIKQLILENQIKKN